MRLELKKFLALDDNNQKKEFKNELRERRTIDELFTGMM